MPFNTLEEAQAEILRLNEELATARSENENYSAQVTSLAQERETLRSLNQQYFLKLSTQYEKKEDPDTDEDDVPTCEDFAKTLTI